MIRFREPSGQLVTVTAADGREQSEPIYCHARYRPRLGFSVASRESWAYQVTSADRLDAGLAALGGRERRRLSFAGGTIVIADGFAGDGTPLTGAAWVGPWHLVSGLFYAPANTDQYIVDYFSRGSFTDTPDGLLISVDGYIQYGTMVVTMLPGIGHLHLASTADVASDIPRFAGQRVPAGEVWRRKSEQGGPDILQIASPSAVGYLHLFDPGTHPVGQRDGFPFLGKDPKVESVGFLNAMTQLGWS